MEQIARTPKQIGAAIRRARREKHLTQEQLASKTNTRQATISALELGETGIRMTTLLDVIAALDLELTIRPRSTSPENIEDLF